ncbi:hypothetical protein BCSAG_54880 [Bacillus cereus]
MDINRGCIQLIFYYVKLVVLFGLKGSPYKNGDPFKMTMRYDSISRVGHFNYTLFQEIRK